MMHTLCRVDSSAAGGPSCKCLAPMMLKPRPSGTPPQQTLCLLSFTLVKHFVFLYTLQVGQFGCGWSFLQVFGPNDAEAQTQRDVFKGTPRSLLFFESTDFQVSLVVTAGCLHESITTLLLPGL